MKKFTLLRSLNRVKTPLPLSLLRRGYATDVDKSLYTLSDTIAKKVIFLDVDGVLLPYSETLEELRCIKEDLDALQFRLSQKHPVYSSIDKLYIGAAFYDWNKDAVNRIKTLCEMQGAKLVITSSWRKQKTLFELSQLFALHDLDQYIVGRTAQISEELRGQEIAHYLENHPEIEQFVIIDDNCFDIQELFPQAFVKCTIIYGEEEHNLANTILSDVATKQMRPTNQEYDNQGFKLKT